MTAIPDGGKPWAMRGKPNVGRNRFPSTVFLANTLSSVVRAQVVEAYARALPRPAAISKRPRVLLATHFGPVADNVADVVNINRDFGSGVAALDGIDR